VFLLLCFFMTANEFARWETEVGITLPTAQSATIPGRMPGEIILNLNAKGDVTINGVKLTLAEVTERMKRIAENFPGQPVVIRADKASSYETLMSLIDACRTANVWNFSLATKDEKKGQ
jgi:biopolymer transport protein ExbD